MSLDKSIEQGKEHRARHYKSKAFDRSCRNHGNCPSCESNRNHSNRVKQMEAEEKITEFEQKELPIKFYSSRDKFREFSNFYQCNIVVDGENWFSCEHYFQAMKSPYGPIQKLIRNAFSPKEAKRLGGQIRLRTDWDEIKYNIMRKIVLAKFEQHPNLQALLLSTGDADLIEDSPWDYTWGCSKDGIGQNWLGKILMETREKLRKTT